MASRWADWFRQAQADLVHAREALGIGQLGHGKWPHACAGCDLFAYTERESRT